MIFKEIFGTKLAYTQIGDSSNKEIPQIIWGHGWQQTHQELLPLAKTLECFYEHILFDFPGFGQSEMPNVAKGSEIYADYVAHLLRTMPKKGKRIWVGFSFGCRVGLYLAYKYPELIDGLFLIASPGLPKTRPYTQKLKIKTKIYTYKLLKKLLKAKTVERFVKKNILGSTDYRDAGGLRTTFLQVVKEDLEMVASKITCPVQLVYGRKDMEAPLYMGKKYNKIISDVNLCVLPKCDHYNMLNGERQKIVYMLKQFVGS